MCCARSIRRLREIAACNEDIPWRLLFRKRQQRWQSDRASLNSAGDRVVCSQGGVTAVRIQQNGNGGNGGQPLHYRRIRDRLRWRLRGNKSAAGQGSETVGANAFESDRPAHSLHSDG